VLDGFLNSLLPGEHDRTGSLGITLLELQTHLKQLSAKLAEHGLRRLPFRSLRLHSLVRLLLHLLEGNENCLGLRIIAALAIIHKPVNLPAILGR